MRRLSAALALSLALGSMLLAGCGNSASAEIPKAKRPREEGVRVHVADPKPSRFRGRVAGFGDLRAEQSAQLGFAVGGRLALIGVQRGQTVKSGQVLGALEPSSARAALGQARAAVRAARAQWSLAQDSFERTVILHRGEVAAEMQLVQARVHRDLAAAQLAGARAQAALAALNLENHVLRAPFEGVVTQVPPGVGTAVGPGVPLFSLESTGALILDTSVTPAQAAALVPGMKVRVSVPATGASTLGTLRAIVPAADPVSHRIPVEVEVANPGRGLFPHVLARAELEIGDRPALELPSTCLVQREGALSVYALNDGGQARRIPVQLLSQERDTSLVELDESLARARVVDLPPPDLADGARVRAGGRP